MAQQLLNCKYDYVKLYKKMIVFVKRNITDLQDVHMQTDYFILLLLKELLCKVMECEFH